jgi:hypothetical protein
MALYASVFHLERAADRSQPDDDEVARASDKLRRFNAVFNG